jgi:hypothetical protein
MTKRSSLLVAGVGCKSPGPRTEILLGVATDLTAPSPLRKVEMTVTRLPEQLVVGTQEWDISGSLDELYELPGTYAVYSRGGGDDRIQVVLDGWDADHVRLVQRRALLTLVPHKTLFVRLGIVSACRGKFDCPTTDTCVDGRCQPAEIDTSRLPEYVDGMEKSVSCKSATTYVDTSTKKPLPLSSEVDAGGACGQGTCSEGVCLAAVPGAFSPTKGPLTEPRSASVEIGAGGALVLDDGRVLFVGGLAPKGAMTLGSAELYDPAKGTFAKTGSLAVARTYFAAAKLSRGRVLIAGGINDGGGALASAEIFDAATGTFTPTKTPMTTPRVFPAATVLADGKVLIAGGMNQIQSYSMGAVSYLGGVGSAELYDPEADTFTATGNLVESRAFAQAVTVAGGALVLCGEFQGGARATIERFDAKTGTFTAKALPPGVTGCTSGFNVLLPDSRLLVTTPPNHAWLYDTVAETFTTAADHPNPTPGGIAALLPDGDVLFAGDANSGQGIGRRAYLFHPPTRSFAFVAGELSVARIDAMGATLPNGDVLVAGGADDASAEIFHAGKSP